MKYKITLNNRTYEVEVQEGNAVLIDEYEAAVAAVKPAAPSAAAASAAPAAPAQAAAPVAAGQQIKAPMPGTVLSVNVAVGQAVKKGDLLAVLEAMKMENELVSPADGTIAQVAVSKGATVDTDALLFVLG